VAKREKPDPLARAVGADGKIDPAKALETVNSLMRIGLLQMNRIQEPFIRAKNYRGKTPRRRILECGEKTGKTRIGIAEDLAHAFGFRPWLEESDPDYKISIPVPNHGLIGCETMAQSVEAKIRPELELLIPAHCGAVPKNDTTGALKSITLKYDYLGRRCDSVLHIRSYNQPADSFRGIDSHWTHWDEPPPRDILIATERGKVVTNAPSWFTMTPLKEAYIYDMFSVKAFNNGGSDQEIAVFHGSMWENCQDYCRACDCYVPENDPENMVDPHAERPKNNCPMCGLIMGFIPRAGIVEYLKLFTDPDELASHIEGKYAHLSGLVYKELDREQHQYQDFPIPRGWMRIEVVDPHDNKPVRWLFGAVSPEDIQINGAPANRIYWYAYLLPTGSIEEIVRRVKVKRAEHDYSDPAYVILDAKYGARSTRNFEGESSWEEDLIKAGVERIRLSHSDPGDIALGHKRVKEYLKPHYSAARGRSVPAMLFAKDGCAGDRGPTQDMFNYQWKPGTDKPEEGYKDFPDCVRYAALEQPVYEQPSSERDRLLALLAAKNEQEYNPMGYGLRTA
jgi:phage terminase large subunit-like protein